MNIEVTHVKFEGDDVSAQAVLAALTRMFSGQPADPPAVIEQRVIEALPEPAAPEPIARRPRPRVAPVVIETKAKPSPAEIKSTSKLSLICREKSGQFSVVEAAALAKVKPQSIHGALAYAKTKGNEWACVGEFQFKRAVLKHDTPAAKADAADDEVMAFNPNITGGNRRQPSEQPTPAHIAAE